MKISGNVPKTVLNWCKRNEEKIYEVHYGDGYNTNSGKAYDILLNRGWCEDISDGYHTIIEGTAKETLEVLKNIRPCKCHDCETGEGW